MKRANIIIVMGVSGVGKSAVGERLACELGGVFLEGDDYHPAANIKKMASGAPLCDADRTPWIDALARAANASPIRPAIISCSALTRFVRQRLAERLCEAVTFVHLTAPADIIRQRLTSRRDHFMKSNLLQSQFDALQQPENAVVIDASFPLEVVCAQVVKALQQE